MPIKPAKYGSENELVARVGFVNFSESERETEYRQQWRSYRDWPSAEKNWTEFKEHFNLMVNDFLEIRSKHFFYVGFFHGHLIRIKIFTKKKSSVMKLITKQITVQKFVLALQKTIKTIID